MEYSDSLGEEDDDDDVDLCSWMGSIFVDVAEVKGLQISGTECIESQLQSTLFQHTAHRTNECRTPVGNYRIKVDLRAVIAGAGSVTHVPRMVAAMTPRAVIGVICQDVDIVRD
jgi:phosphoribosylcarboxyaminoimidazole (NCAIR) mutase